MIHMHTQSYPTAHRTKMGSPCLTALHTRPEKKETVSLWLLLQLLSSDFFPFKLLSPEKKVLYKPLCDPAVLHMTVCVTTVEIPVLFLWIVILLCICHFIGIFHKHRILCSETICKQSCNF